MSERVEVLEIDLTEVQTEAEETGQTLKELRAEVKELRNTLENTEIGTEEFGNALSDLTRKQQELTNVTKSGIAAQKGSYNDLVNQMAILKMEWRATADEGKRAALGAEIADINSKLKEMDASVGNYQRNVGNYRQELKQLKEDLLSLEEGTEEYSNALARAAEISQKMQDVNEFVAQSAQDMGDHLQNVTGVAAGMVGAFQTVQASLNLIGVESENVEKMIATMQNLMAITQGLTAIEGAIDKYKRLNETIKGLTIVQNLFGTAKKKTTTATVADTAATVANTAATTAQTGATTAATTATWSFNAALAANPLGAILIAVTAVVTALVSLVSWLGTAGDTAEDAAAKNDRLTDSLARQNRWIEQNIQLWQAQGMSRKDALIASLDEQEKVVQEALDNYLSIRSAADNSERWFGLANPRSDKEQEQIDAAWQIYLDEKNKLAEREFEIQVEGERERTESQKRYAQESARIAQQAAQQRTALLEKELADRKKRIEDNWKSILEIEEEYEDKLTEIRFENEIAFLPDEEQRIKRIQRTYEQLTNSVVEDSNAAINALWQLYREGEITLEEYNQRATEIQNLTGNYSINLFSQQMREIREEQERAMKERIDRLRTQLSEEQNLYKENRDRILRAVVATEHAVDQARERIPEGASSKYKIELEEELLRRLESNYAAQLKLLNAQDEAERESIERLMNVTLERQSAMRAIIESDQSTTSEIANARMELAMLDELLADLGEQWQMVGAESLAVAESLQTVTDKLSHIGIEKTIADLETVKEGFEDLKNTFSELNDLGGAFSDEWSRVFDTIIDGIDVACQSLRDMDSVLDSNATKVEKTAAKWKGYGQMAAAGLSVAASLMGALADEQDKTTEEGFERSKKFQIAQAVMSTLSGVASAWASSMQLGPIAGPIMGAILSAMMLTMGGLQIANIKKQKFDSSGLDGSSQPPIPSLSAINAMGTPVSATTNIEGASTEGQVRDQRVYVVENDITTAQNSVKVAVDEATF